MNRPLSLRAAPCYYSTQLNAFFPVFVLTNSENFHSLVIFKIGASAKQIILA